MPVVTSTRTLRRQPNGESTGQDAPAGARIDILGQTDDGWTNIRVPGLPGAPEGWVTSLVVDADRDTLGPIDKLVFASNCAWDAIIISTSAHYMLAVAELRSDISDGASSTEGDWGPFCLNAAEWAIYSQMPDAGVAFKPADRTDWLAQCMVFANMANTMQSKLAALLTDQPTVLELYLGQMVGSSAAKSMLATPTGNPKAVLAAVPTAELGLEAVSLDRSRDAKYMNLATCADLISTLRSDLQRALDDTRQFATQINTQLLGDDDSRVAPESLPSLDINFKASVIPQVNQDNAKRIAARFQAAGYGAIQQIAAIANAIAESSLDAAASGDNGHSHGLFQLNQNGGVGNDQPTDVLTDPEQNIAIMLNYMATEKKSADLTFRAATDIVTAVSIFVHDFERPANQAGEIAKRVGIAQKLVV